MLDELSKLVEAIDLPADWVGIRALKESVVRRTIRDQQPEANSRNLSQGAMVEVLAYGQFGYSATNLLTPSALREAVKQAYYQAKAASTYRIHPFTVATRPRVVGEYISPQLQPLDRMRPADLCSLLSRICAALKVSEAIVQTVATAITNQYESWFVSSNGSSVYQNFALLETYFSATGQSGAVVQTRSNNGMLARSYQGGWECLSEADLWAQVNDTAEQVMALLAAPDCPDETTTLVLAPDQMMLQIHESIGHPLELDRILGDERNYAGGSFVKPQDFGRLQYGSPLMNVTFNPGVEGELASYAFDDTGAPASQQYLIREGRLERGLGSLESQARLGVPGVACARASSWNRPAIDRMGNINLEPGTTPLKDLIGGIERGVFMETNRSWSIDDQRYKFQFGCEYGRLIEDGELTRVVRNPNYRATTPSFWRSLAQVGDASTWEIYGTPFCGKGEPNQIIRVGHAAPVCAFEGVEVFGGGR